jgi:L-alanine-DL-glutamate epimerase-like enolase superfamily enzyme
MEPMSLTRRKLLASLPSIAPAQQGALRITGFDIATVRVPFAGRVRDAWIRSWVNQKRGQTDFVLNFVRLRAGDGLVGVGEAKMDRAKAEAKLRAMVGRGANDYLMDDSIGGILIAAADLIGKAAGKSVAHLLAPSPRRTVAPVWWSQCFPPDVMASEAKLGVARGYRVHKVKARPWEDPIAQAAAMCAVVPKHFKFWVDANSSWETVEHTLRLTRELEKFDNYFAIESPIARQNIDGYRALKGKTRLKISEHVDNIDLDVWTREKLLDAWISGAPRLGKYLRDLNAKSAAARVPVWIEHSIDNGIADVFQAHQAAAYPGIEYVISVTNVLEDDFLKEPFTVRDGLYEIPKGPGLGVSLDEAAVEKYRTG